MAGSRRAWAMGLSAVLHGAVGLVAWRTVPRVESVTIATVAPVEASFEMLDPPPPPPEETPTSAPSSSPGSRTATLPSRPPRSASSAMPASPPSGGGGAPPTVAQPVLPAPAPTPAPPRVGTAAELLGGLQERALAQVTSGAIGLEVAPAPARNRDLVVPRTGTPEEQARAASAGYVAERMAEMHQHEAAGVRGYFWTLRRRMEESWSPSSVREPTIGETAIASVAMPAAMLLQTQRSAQGSAVEPGRRGSAIDALEAANVARGGGPGNLTQVPFTGIIDASQGNTRRTRAEVEVIQDADGVVTSVRVLRGSGREVFDREAERAVREALPMASAVAMPGGRRSRWSFEVVVSRDPFMPGVGMSFDESSGWVEFHWPGRLHARRRVWLEDARPASASGPRPG